MHSTQATVHRLAQKSLRATTAPLRRLPDFLVIGVMKGATSSLFGYLQQHPRIAGPYKKEVHFFDSGFDRGQLWYRAHFPITAGKHTLTGEATPSYILNPHAPGRIRRVLGDVPMILMLRDPVSRAFSHYRHMVRVGREELPFAEAIDNADFVAAEMARVLADPAYPDAPLRDKSYLLRGLYLEQIQRYLAHFDRERIHILSYEDFVRAPEPAMAEVCRFLGIEPYDFDCSRHHNVGIGGKMEPALKTRLQDYYRAPNAALYDFLGQDFGW
ncbi:MAG: sulfotransferase [Kiloniellaceae bacterium]